MYLKIPGAWAQRCRVRASICMWKKIFNFQRVARNHQCYTSYNCCGIEYVSTLLLWLEVELFLRAHK